MSNENLSSIAALTIGIFGSILFIISCGLGLYCRYYAINQYTKRIFTFICLSSACEIPRYIEFMIVQEYVGRSVYCIHTLGNLFYFTSFSCLCYSWGDVLRAKNLEEFFETKRKNRIRIIITAANVIFTLNTLAVIYRCASVSSLSDFFKLKIFLAYTISDTTKNFIMGIFISQFGYNLYQKVNNYSEFYGRSSPTQTALIETTKSLLTAGEKLRYLIIIILISFSIRVLAVILWFTSNAQTENQAPSYFPPCSILYWFIFEIFPAIAPQFTLCLTMGYPAKMWRGGVFIDANRTKTLKRYTSDSSDTNDEINDSNLPTPASTSGLTNPILSQGHSQYDEDEKQMFHNLSRLSRELGDLEIDPTNSYWKEYSDDNNNHNHNNNNHAIENKLTNHQQQFQFQQDQELSNSSEGTQIISSAFM